MATVCYPLDNNPTNYTGEMVRQALSPLYGWAPPGRPLGAQSGVTRGTPTTTIAVTGSGPYSVQVGVHSGVLDVEQSTTAGPYGYANNSNTTTLFNTATSANVTTINTANSTNPRIDLICVQVTDTSESDVGTQGVRFTYTPGTAAATPSAPATPTDSMPLAQITVPSTSAGGAPSAAWVAPVFSQEPIAAWSGANLTGRSIPNATTTAPSGWTISVAGGFSQNITYGASTWTVLIPGYYEVAGQLAYSSNSTGNRYAQLLLNGDATSPLAQKWEPAGANATCVSFAWGGVLAAGDVLSLNTYQSSGATLTLISNGGYNTISIVRRMSVA